MMAVSLLLIMLPITVLSANFISRDFIYSFGMHNKSESFRQLLLIPLINRNILNEEENDHLFLHGGLGLR